MIDPIDEYVIQ